jgi:exopolysaccharide production protein ExoQ
VINADNISASNSQSRNSLTIWFVGALLAAAMVGLIHDRGYATAFGANSVEEGRGIDDATVMDEGLGAAQIGRVIGLCLLMTAGAVCIITTRDETRIRCDSLSYLMIIGALWGTASVLWSVEPGTTARALVRVFVYAGVAFAMVRRFDPRSLCYVLVIMLGGSVLTAVLFEIGTGGFRPWQSDYRLTGTMHSNVLAIQTAVVAIIAYAFAFRENPRKVLWWTIFLVALVVVYLTKARAALITVIAGAAAVHIVGRPARNWLTLALAAAGIVTTCLLGATMLGLLDGREFQALASMGRNDDSGDLTGRLPLWNYIWEQSAGHRLQGFGCGAFWVIERTLAANDALEWYPRHSHNAYLQIIVNLGIVGLIICLAVGIWAFVRNKRLIESTGLAEYSAMAAILVGMFVNGCAESVFVMPRDMGLITNLVVLSVVVAHGRHAGETLSRHRIRQSESDVDPQFIMHETCQQSTVF